MDDRLVVLVTVPSQDVGKDLARMLLSEKLAACVNIVPSIVSLYTWEGELCTDDEALLMIKTTEAALQELISAVSGDHPYDVPEIIAVPITAGSTEYLSWIGEVVTR